METNASELKISMKMLNSEETANSRTPAAPPPDESGKVIRIRQVLNYLPYSCIVDIIPPEDIDWVYYAVLDSKGNKLFYKSEYPNKPLASFSIHEIKTDEKEIQFVCWPVKDNIVGSPTYYGPIPLNSPFYLGAYDLVVHFEKESDKVLFEKVKPLIEKHYGKAALPGNVKVQEATHDVFLPSSNTINLSADRRNIIHELIHANRKQILFANKQFKFDEETELIEEFFAEGVNNMIKDELNLEPNDYLQKGAVYGSTHGYNYDFRIADPSLITQNLQSSFGGILTLENARYYLASEAYHKIAVEYLIKTGKYFGKEFNRIYYDLVQRTLEDPSREMFYSICEQLMDTIEGKATRRWLEDQKIFNSEYQEGEKLFMDVNDYYTSDEWLGITNINLYTTFANGSDWAYKNKRYSMNGESVKVELTHLPSGLSAYSSSHNIPIYENGFGAIKLYFYGKKDSTAVPYFQEQDVRSRIDSFKIFVEPGLYAITLTSKKAKRTYFRLMGDCMFEGKDKLMISNPFMKGVPTNIQLTHYNRDKKKTVLPVQRLENHMTIFDAPFIKDTNCEPGILQIQVNAGGFCQNFQRNIGYGSAHGGHQFLIGADIDTFLPVDTILDA